MKTGIDTEKKVSWFRQENDRLKKEHQWFRDRLGPAGMKMIIDIRSENEHLKSALATAIKTLRDIGENGACECEWRYPTPPWREIPAKPGKLIAECYTHKAIREVIESIGTENKTNSVEKARPAGKPSP